MTGSSDEDRPLCRFHDGLERDIRHVCSKMDEREKHINTRFQMLDRENKRTREDLERRLEGMNEFRAQLERQGNTFVSRRDLDLLFDKWEVQIKENAKAIQIIKTELATKLGEKHWTDYLITMLVSAFVYAIGYLVFKLGI